jgi:predicted O-methyltransferase YrrM
MDSLNKARHAEGVSRLGVSRKPPPLLSSMVQGAKKVLPLRLKRWMRKYLYPSAPTVEYGVSLMPPHRLGYLLDLLEQAVQKDLPGDVLECGTYRGGSAVAMGAKLAELGSEKKLLAVDLFEDFRPQGVVTPADRQSRIEKARVTEKFAGSQYNRVVSVIKEKGLAGRVNVYRGPFSEVFPLLADRTFCFAHVDADFYSSVRECIEFLQDRLTPGGIVLFDEYDNPRWPGAKKAVDELLGTEDLVSRPGYQTYWVKR